MKSKIFMTFFGGLVVPFLQLEALVLNQSIPGRYNEGYRTPEQQGEIIKLVDIYKESGEYLMGMLGYVEYPDGKWYSLNRDLNIQGGNVDNQKYLGKWPLTRWPYEPLEEKVRLFQADIYDDLNLIVSESIGCLNATPLRYGDIEGDGDSELVLFLGYDLLVFSPQYAKTIFMANFNVPGWRSLEDTDSFFEFARINKNDEGVPQYQNFLDEHYGDALAGIRGYAKLYFGDFDENGRPDILVWRKLYESNMASDPVKGFHKLSDTFYHYETSTEAGSTGEYLPQETNQTVIQSWLSENNHTWQSGYPSKSECEGEEGQLIPEMHDPLLNDDDVLK